MSAGSEGASQQVRFGLLVAAACLAVVAVYMPTLGAPFLWDDALLVRTATEAGHWWSFFSASFWTEQDWGGANSSYFRPITLLTLSWDAAAHGSNPAGFHLTNLIVHLVNLVLLCHLLRRAVSVSAPGQPIYVAGWAVGLALFFGLSPRVAESVAWVSGRTDLLATCFSLAALLAWRKGRIGRWLASICLLLAMLSKEVALATWLSLLVSTFLDRRRGQPWVESAAGLCVPAFSYVVLRLSALSEPTAASTELHLLQRGIVVLESIGRYLWMLLNPWQPRTQMGNPEAPSLIWAGFGVLALTLVVWGTRRLLVQRGGCGQQGVVLALSGFGLVCWLWPLPLPVVTADRFMYLPLCGVLLVLASVVPSRVYMPRVVSAGAVLIGVGLGHRCYERVLDFADEGRFWFTAVSHAPLAPIAWSELGSTYFRAGHFERARACYERAASLRPSALELSNVALGRASVGDYTMALPPLVSAAKLNPLAAKLQFDLAVLRLRRLEPELAAAPLRRCQELGGMNADCGKLREELPALQASVRELSAPLADSSWPGLAARARLETRLGRTFEATEHWARLLRSAAAPKPIADEAMLALIRFAPPPLAAELVPSFLLRGGDEALLGMLAVRAEAYESLSSLPEPASQLP